MSEKQLTELLLCTLCNSNTDNEKFQLTQSIVFSSWKHLPYNVFHSAKSNLLANSLQIAPQNKNPFAALCRLCYESTVLLSKLNSQLEDIQKKILETAKYLTAHVVKQAEKSKIHRDSSSPTADEGSEQSPDNFTKDITTKEEFIIPDVCETTQPNFPDLELQKTTEENENSSENNIHQNKCPKCSRIFSGPKVLEKHSCRLRTWDCKKCGISYSSKGILQHHLCGKSYICDLCGVEFDLLNNLVAHRSTHKDTLGFKCDLCPNTKCFLNKQSVMQHKRRNHLHQEKGYKCNVCLRFFKRFNKLLSCQKKHKQGWTENSTSGNIAGDKRNQNNKEKEVQNQSKTLCTEESSKETTLMDVDVQDPVLLQLDPLQNLPQSSTTNVFPPKYERLWNKT